MSGKIAKSQVPVRSSQTLPQDVRIAIAQLKEQLRAGHLPRIFNNNNLPLEGIGSPLPRLDDGCVYREFQVGVAHPGDPRPTGKRRLVAEIVEKPCQIRALYFSDEHYLRGTFVRID
ncbi:MAG: hypothetical protein KDB01_14360 [Planctomycetaceae bacterium]|nr:hypothetical protein [Planctomycetaceae bacterium]